MRWPPKTWRAVIGTVILLASPTRADNPAGGSVKQATEKVVRFAAAVGGRMLGCLLRREMTTEVDRILPRRCSVIFIPENDGPGLPARFRLIQVYRYLVVSFLSDKQSVCRVDSVSFANLFD